MKRFLLGFAIALLADVAMTRAVLPRVTMNPPRHPGVPKER